MAVKDIATVFTTTGHSVIGSRYERSLYEDDKSMLEDFKNDIALQFKTYNEFDGEIETFAVIVKDDDDGTVCQKAFTTTDEGPIDKDEIIEYVEGFFEEQ